MKKCIECGSLETAKWYRGPLCRKCYCKKHYNSMDLSYWSARSARYRRTERGSYNTTKGNAVKKGIEWNLSFEEFKEARKTRECFYCLGPLPKVCGGLDRKDNKKGYELENVVPCCAKCNYLKRDLLSFEETVAIIKLLKELRNGRVWV